MRALAHFVFAAVITVFYGGRVCPFINQLTLTQWAQSVAVAFALGYGLRRLLIQPWVERSPVAGRVLLRARAEFALFLLLGLALAASNTLVLGFPLLASGGKVLAGCLILGAFAAADLALEEERRIALLFLRTNQELLVGEGMFPLSRQFALAATFVLFSVVLVVLLILVRDFDWVAGVERGSLELPLRAVLVELTFVLAVALAEILNLIASFSRNLRLAFDNENSALARVAQGDLGSRVVVSSNNEFGLMASYTNRMILALEQRTRDLALTQEVTIIALASLAETRDNETGNHILRTQRYVRELAGHLSGAGHAELLTPQYIDLLYQSAPLHDIGKVGIPDAILLKPGKLDAGEFSIMKRHPQYGHDALQAAVNRLGPTSFLRLAQEVALSHHEKWDGSGYPKGLSAGDIPLSGRLMALADVYDALICKRVYKRAFSHEETRAIILEGRGVHFDPQVVEAFLAVEERFLAIAREYSDAEQEAPRAEGVPG
ncbi:MAG: HD domain-containing protein [Proteobacteria bacterium]|nr:HD domain-containing protein [Pseudomonadota bacterium]MBU1596509.1 HD domain-containing protein [Pseudomonadota bacterium]